MDSPSPLIRILIPIQSAPIKLYCTRISKKQVHFLFLPKSFFFEFPYFAIYSAERFPSQSDGNTLHIKELWKADFSERFLCKMSMLPKAARPFGTIISAIIKNRETQTFFSLTNIIRKITMQLYLGIFSL